MDDAGGTAGGSRGKVRLLEQQHAASSERTLPGDGYTIDAATNDDCLKMFAGQRRALLYLAIHRVIRCKKEASQRLCCRQYAHANVAWREKDAAITEALSLFRGFLVWQRSGTFLLASTGGVNTRRLRPMLRWIASEVG